MKTKRRKRTGGDGRIKGNAMLCQVNFSLASSYTLFSLYCTLLYTLTAYHQGKGSEGKEEEENQVDNNIDDLLRLPPPTWWWNNKSTVRILDSFTQHPLKQKDIRLDTIICIRRNGSAMQNLDCLNPRWHFARHLQVSSSLFRCCCSLPSISIRATI